MKTGMICPSCGEGRLELKQDRVGFNYLNVEVTIPIQHFKCNLCSTGLFSDEVSFKLEKFLKRVRKGIKNDLEFKEGKIDG